MHAGMVDYSPGGVKVLGRGEVTKKLNLVVQAITPSARQKIEAAGGSVELAPFHAKKEPAKGNKKATASETGKEE